MESQEAETPVTPGTECSAEDITSRLESFEAERCAFEQKVAELNDQLLRRAAEFENYRRRTERERGEFFEYAASDAVKAMLPVLDDFERALKAPCGDAEYVKGVGLIYSRMFETLKKLGLEPVEALGKPFDPNFHHAIELVNTSEADDQTVLDELQRGYTFKGRLLRPAMVRVASGS